MKTYLLLTLILVVGAGIWPEVSVAAIKYGSGYYTNLCGSGTQATAYTCDNRCSPTTGTCSATNDGAVRYVCRGNWNQCLENESGWTNGISLGDPGCDYTTQLSVYDHKCRNSDGSWDSTCRLLGYMVWYSGDCRPGVAGYTTGVPQSPTPTPTRAPTSKFSSPTPSVKVTPTVMVSPTLSKTQPICNKTCTLNSDCATGFVCQNKTCRNKDCPSDNTCFCNLTATSSGKLGGNGTTVSPETGAPLWLMVLGILGLGYMGLKVLHVGKVLWG